jgi:hypothetical protein
VEPLEALEAAIDKYSMESGDFVVTVRANSQRAFVYILSTVVRGFNEQRLSKRPRTIQSLKTSSECLPNYLVGLIKVAEYFPKRCNNSLMDCLSEPFIVQVGFS